MHNFHRKYNRWYSTKAALNDPCAYGIRCMRRRRFKPRDRQTDRLTDTANIGKNRQHLMHLMQPNNKMP